MSFLILLLLFCHFLLLFYPSSSLPLCTDLRAPTIPKDPLTFCPHYHGRVCCDSVKDFELQKQFEAMNISDSSCASLVKSILCAMCDKFSADLFKVESEPRRLPVLCNSTTFIDSKLPNKSANSFCSTVWDGCQNVPILNSPFAPSQQVRKNEQVDPTSSKLSEFYQTKSKFCASFGSSDDRAICFDGEPVSLESSETLLHSQGLCLEKIGNGAYLNMVAHPDGSNRAFFAEQSGKIWLATVPEQGSGGTLGIYESNPFLDLTSEVYYSNSFGLMGLAFHPNFANNGRFFASYNCDKVKTPGCSGRCSCYKDLNCDPSQLGSSNAAQPCRYHKVIAEFSANGTSEPSLAKSAMPLEVRRIFTLGLPFPFNHGGQILFGPRDGYLYVMMGDGGQEGDPHNFAQNKKSLLGKILRINIDNIQNTEQISELGLWGNYSIPQDNPYSEDKKLEPEIWALGLRNPWRCSFDSQRPLYFICADTGQVLAYITPTIIGHLLFDNNFRPHISNFHSKNFPPFSKGGNYGWNIYEGPFHFNPQQPRGGTASANSTDIIFPIYCNSIPGSLQPALGYIYSFGEDNSKDILLLASSGVYRVVDPSRCNYFCSKEGMRNVSSSSPISSSCRNQLINPYCQQFFPLLSILLLLLVFSL